MKNAIAALLLMAFLLVVAPARADVNVSIGVGKGILSGDGTPFERAAAIGYQFPWGDFFVRPEVGYFTDLSGQGKSSFWAAPLAGVRATTRLGPEMHLAVGPGYLSNPDQVLGGHFQFSLEGGLGLEDKNVYIGLAWKHLSSAGIEMPNQGRDFIVVQVRVLKF